MVNYKCIICKYSTKNKSDYDKHNQTKKHLKKQEDSSSDNILTHMSRTSHAHLTQKSQKSVCKYCDCNFTRPDILSRHLKSCISKLQREHELESTINDLNTKFEHTVETLNIKLIQSEKETDHYKEERNYYKRLLEEAGGLVKKSVSALTFVVNNYDGAPALQTISFDDIPSFKNTENNIVEDILSAYKHKTLGSYLGNFIVIYYKKDDPKSQSIWNTDDSRLTYLIKELLSNKSSNWIIDKKGVKTKEYLIDPILSHVKKLLISFQANLVIPDLNKNSVELEFLLENSKKIIDLINDIDDGVVGKEILKYISAHLRFNGKMIE